MPINVRNTPVNHAPRIETSRNVSSPSTPTPSSPTTPRTASSPTATQDARPSILRREDNFFPQSEFQKNGKTNKKSHLDINDPSRVTLKPANAAGNATPLDHVQGNVDQKARSPYTSFTPGEHQGAKAYGKYEVEVNRDKLVKDAQAGKLPGVQVLDNAKVQQSIKDDIKTRTGVTVNAPVPHADIPTFVAAQGLSKNKAKQLDTRLQALANTGRDNEVLVKGEIPSEYIRRVGLHRDEQAKLKAELQTKVNGNA